MRSLRVEESSVGRRVKSARRESKWKREEKELEEEGKQASAVRVGIDRKLE